VPLRERRPDLPRDLTDVVERALAHDPADRFRSADAMVAAIASGAHASGVRTMPFLRLGDDRTVDDSATVGSPDGTAQLVPDQLSPEPSVPHRQAHGRGTQPRRTLRRRRGSALVAGLAALVVALVVVAAVLVLGATSTQTPSGNRAPSATNPPTGPAAPLPGPLEKSLRNLEKMVQR
jgi:hypothetical protein